MTEMMVTERSRSNPLRLMREASSIGGGVVTTQEDLVNASGMAWSTIWRFEEGRALPSRAAAQLLVSSLMPNAHRTVVVELADKLREELIEWQRTNTPEFVRGSKGISPGVNG